MSTKDNLHFNSQDKLKAGIDKVAQAVSEKPKRVFSEQARKNMSLARIGKVPWNKGTKGVMKANSGSFKKGERRSVATEFNSEKTKGEANVNWKGVDVAYNALHHWVRRNFEKDNRCEHCGNEEYKPRRYQWANKSGQYLRERSDWLRLCASCHKHYDLSRKKEYVG
jgi:hypothetical protein